MVIGHLSMIIVLAKWLLVICWTPRHSIKDKRQMTEYNHYDTLHISPSATPAEIKQAYRHLAKQFHPDSHSETANHDAIIQINAAYEVLGDPQRRQSYDQHLLNRRPKQAPFDATHSYKQQTQNAAYTTQRQQREAAAVSQNQYQYRKRGYSGHTADEQLQRWLKQVYSPVNRLLCNILNSLAEQLDELSGDPFDDELMEAFQDYLKECRQHLNQAQVIFRSQPNPSIAAGAAVHLYYSINQISDGLDELELFTLNYDDHYLHTGQELFRIAAGLHCEAQSSIPNKQF